MTVAPATLAPAASAPPRHRRLYRDAASLASSSMLTAVLGFGFWALCARLVPPAELGVQTALMSIITAPAIVVASGIGDAFTALLPIAGHASARVVRRGYQLLLAVSTLLGVAAAALAVTLLPQVRASLSVAALVACGVVVWALFVVQDPALTSMERAHWLPIENGSVSIAKVGLLPLGLGVGVAHPVVAVSLLPSIAAVAVLLPRVRRLAAARSDAGFELGADLVEPVSELSRLALRTTVSIAMSLGVLTATPFLVAAAGGPVQGAVFSLGLSIVQSLDFVGAALGVSLVVHASGAGREGARMARVVFARAVAIVGSGALALVLLAPVILHLLGGRYLRLHGALVITLLALGSASRTGYVIWAALQRSRRRMRALMCFNAVAAALVLAGIAPVTARWGAVGAAALVASANLVLSLLAGAHVFGQWWASGRRPLGRHRVPAGPR